MPLDFAPFLFFKMKRGKNNETTIPVLCVEFEYVIRIEFGVTV